MPRFRLAMRGLRKSAPANPAATQDDVAIVNHRSLTWRDSALRLMQANPGAILFQRNNGRERAGMIVTNFDRRFERQGGLTAAPGRSVVAGVGDPGGSVVAGVGDPGGGVVAGVGDPGGSVIAGVGDPGGAVGITDPGYRVPVHSLDLEFLNHQIVRLPNNDAVCRGIEIDDVTRTQRAARQTFALANGEELDAVVFAQEISLHIINRAAMKLLVAEARAQKRLVILARHEADFLAVHFVGDFKA